MAWRIEQQVIRGEIDNRARGRVVGRVWLLGREQPLELDLEGNGWRDLAGRRLEFVNPAPRDGDTASLASEQRGIVGDCTGSRKAKVPDVTHEELIQLLNEKKPFPWHWANCVYLEWFSEANGRVVIESGDYELTITGEATWEMSEAEEEQQRRANGAALVAFMQRLGRLAAPLEALTDADDETDAGSADANDDAKDDATDPDAGSADANDDEPPPPGR